MSGATTLVNFIYSDTADYLNGSSPTGGLIMDARGDLFGVTSEGGADNEGTVFEIAYQDGTYASAPIVIASFNGVNGAYPVAGLTMDAAGDIFGTASEGGAYGNGVVFEIAYENGSYASAPSVLVSLTDEDGSEPETNLVFDAQGDLFGTSYSGGDSALAEGGMVFEIPNDNGSYASTANVIAAFTYPLVGPFGNLVMNADGDLLGVTQGDIGGKSGGSIFELAYENGSYASAPIMLVQLSATSGTGIIPFPVQYDGLAMNAQGDVFAVSPEDDSVLELPYNNGIYGAAVTLAQAGGDIWPALDTPLFVDAAGDLIGTGGGRLFEIADHDGIYDHSITVLASLSGIPDLESGVILDANGKFAGESDDYGQGAIFEIACFLKGNGITTEKGEIPVEDVRIGDLLPTLHGGLRRVKWVGQRSYRAPFCNHPNVLPICIRAGALADGVPARDLHLSPGHALCIDGHFIRAARLVNNVSIVQARQAEQVEYYHIETEGHEVIFAEACPVETFRDENFRRQFQNEAEFHLLYPQPAITQAACLPVLEHGFLFQAIRQRIAARAGLGVAAPAALRGYVDEAGPARAAGWAQNLGAPDEPVCLDIYCAGVRLGRVMADMFRQDIQQAGLGGGYCGFEFALEPGLGGEIEVRRAADGAKLPYGAALQGKGSIAA